MKELTTEEKARSYDKAIGKAAALYKASEPMSGCNVIIETLFPELAESKDEKIRKTLIQLFQSDNEESFGEFTNKQFVAWLEKQGEKDILEDAILDGYILNGNEDGLIAETIKYKNEKQAEQNQTDKVKPKFKVGDWIINPRTGLIKHIKNVLLCDNNGNYEFESSSMSIDSVDNSFHLWTIQDAKDGDVLTNGKMVVIFKHFEEPSYRQHIVAYIGLDRGGDIQITDDTWRLGIDKAKPATKEQRDLLFQKMHEAGYEWDARNKVMTKIEQKPADSYCQENCNGFQETGKCFADGECKTKREAEQELTDLEEFINELSKQFPDVSFAKLSRIAVRVAKWAKPTDEDMKTLLRTEYEKGRADAIAEMQKE